MNDYGVDIGTVNTLIYKKNKGVLVNEPSIIATDTLNNKTLAVGNEAKKMLGRSPSTISVDYTVHDGVINSYDKAANMLRDYFGRIPDSFGGNRLMVSIPSRATAVEKRAVEDVAYAARAKRVHLIEEPIAAAIGADQNIFEPHGRMIVDIGGGTTEIAVISLGGVVAYNTLTQAGNQFDRDIINLIRRDHNVLIGDPTAEMLKIKLANIEEYSTMEFLSVSGRDLAKGLPVNIAVSSDDIRDAIMPSVHSIIDGIKYTMEHVDPELSSDIISGGILLVGGSSLIHGWDEIIYNSIGVKAEVVPFPLECVAVGAGIAIDMIDELKKYNSLF